MAIRIIHPDDHLMEELAELNMSAAELAHRLAVPTNRITSILNSQRSISADTACASPTSSEQRQHFG